MGDFMKMASPVILTLLLSGLGTITYSLFERVNAIEDHQISGQKYITMLEQMRKELDDHEKRIRNDHELLIKEK